MGKQGRSKYQTLFEQGQQYNSWTITGPVVMDGEAKVHVTCRCGYSAAVSCYAIAKGTSKGCLRCDQKSRLGSNNSSWRGYGQVPGSFIQRYRHKAKQKGWVWEIDAQFVNTLIDSQKGKCALTGLPISFKNVNYDIGYSCTASLDRIDSKKGYTAENTQLVHKDVNIMKNQYQEEYFIEICKLVAKTK